MKPAHAAIRHAWSLASAYSVVGVRNAGAVTPAAVGAISGTASLSFSAQSATPGDNPPRRRSVWRIAQRNWEPEYSAELLRPPRVPEASFSSGVSSLGFTNTATLRAKGRLLGTSTPTFTGTGTLRVAFGPSLIAGTATIAFSNTASGSQFGISQIAGVASQGFFARVNLFDVTIFLNDPKAPRCWLLEFDAFPLVNTVTPNADAMMYSTASYSEFSYSEGSAVDVGNLETLYFSDLGYTSHTTDSPASQWYDGRLMKGFRIERKIVGRDGIGGHSQVFAQATLLNLDGGLDSLTLARSLHGRDARIYVGHPDEPKSNFVLVASVTINRVWQDLNEVRLSFIDRSAKLQYALNRNTYGGTGGATFEGGADLKGKYRPKAYGAPRNVMPPLVDSAALIYQVHDGQVNDVPTVYDRGIALAIGPDYSSAEDMIGNQPAPGQFRVWKEGGLFRLGATPAGTVTADVEGDAAISYTTTTSAIVERILQNQAEVTPAEIDAASFAALASAAPAPVGIWVGTEGVSVADAIEELLYGIGAFGGFSRLGVYKVARVANPSGVSAATFSDEDIIRLERVPLPASMDPIVWRTRVGWKRNSTVQTDLASGVADDHRAFAAERARFEKIENYTLQSQHVMARELDIDALFRDQTDAEVEAARVHALWSSSSKAIYRALVGPRALVLDIGDIVTLQHTRFGLSAGSLCLILGHAITGPNVELTVLAE